MKGHAVSEDWEILPGEDLKPPEVPGDVSFADAIKIDYFALACRKPGQEEAALAGSPHTEEEEVVVGHAGSDSPLRIDPDSGSRVPQGFRSDGSENEQLEDVGGSEIAESRELEGSGSEVEKSVEDDDSSEHAKVSSVEVSDENAGSDKVLAWGGKRRWVVWRKLLFEFVEFYACKVKRRWAVCVAAAILGIWLLRKRMCRVYQATQSLPMKINLDEKKASLLKSTSVARLNESFITKKRVPAARASLSSGTVNPPSVLNLE